jgi:hypothetical protein
LPAVRELAQAHFCRHESFHSGEKGFTMAAKTAPKTNVVRNTAPRGRKEKLEMEREFFDRAPKNSRHPCRS